MVRKLPWEATAAPKPERRTKKTTHGRASKPPDYSDDHGFLDDFLPVESDHSDDLDAPSSNRYHHAHDTADSSPPRPRPKEEEMIPGWENDDGWRMVEDEFIETARLFSAHAHRAEYKRRMLQPRSQTRSTHGKSVPEGSNAMAARAREHSKKLKTGLAKYTESSDDDPFMGDPRFAHLMGSQSELVVEPPFSVTSALVRTESGPDPELDTTTSFTSSDADFLKPRRLPSRFNKGWNMKSKGGVRTVSLDSYSTAKKSPQPRSEVKRSTSFPLPTDSKDSSTEKEDHNVDDSDHDDDDDGFFSRKKRSLPASVAARLAKRHKATVTLPASSPPAPSPKPKMKAPSYEGENVVIPTWQF